MTPQHELNRVMKAVVGPFLREQGFQGTSPTWHRRNALGDAVVVNVQRSRSSTAAEVRCIINLAVLPKPWIEWRRHSMPGTDFDRPRECDGVWHQRLTASKATEPTDVWWHVTDATTADAAGANMLVVLEGRGLPTLAALLDREHLLAELHDYQGVPSSASTWGVALLLADHGMSPELEHMLDDIGAKGGPSARTAQQLIQFIRSRAGNPTT